MPEPRPEGPTAAAEAEAPSECQPLLSPTGTRKADARRAESKPQPSIMPRVAAAMLSFFVLGIHTAALGVLIPYMEPYYAIGDGAVSLVFVTPLAGYLVASVTNSAVHATLGRRGIALIGTVCQVVVSVIAACHPPYPVFLLAFAVVGYGVGLIDAGWCAWAGGLGVNANAISGFLHGAYSAGATVGPYLTVWLIAGLGWPWWSFYWVMSAMTGVEVVVLGWAFWRDTEGVYVEEKERRMGHGQDEVAVDGDGKGNSKPLWRYSVLWICGVYLIAYVGAEGIVAGWIVTFMLRIRAATPYTASICASGFWAGMALGRVVLGSLTDRFGERLSVAVYLLAALASQALFCFVKPTVVSAVSITMLGFFLGPVFPTGIVMITRLMPRELHVSAVAAVASAGQVGNAGFPFILGATADRLGIQALQPFVFVLLAFTLGAWLCFPRLPAKEKVLVGHEEETDSLFVDR